MRDGGSRCCDEEVIDSSFGQSLPSAVGTGTREGEGWEQALASRVVVERATGVLMERHRLTAEHAGGVLVSASREAGMPLLELAQAVLGSGRTDEPPVIRKTLARPGEPAALQRAIAFIDAHAESRIRLADIVAAAGIAARALQYDFLRHHQITPLGYLRRVRLERAHRDLLAADPAGGDTVSAIAARWGFAKTGRFAEQYRAAYGRLPSQTLSA